MARSPAAAGILDVRSNAIFQDVTWATNPCAPGADRIKPPIDQFYEPNEGVGQRLDNRNPGDVGLVPGPDDTRFDQSRDWIALTGAAIIASTIIGIIQSYATLIPYLGPVYGIGQVEAIVIGSVTYFILIAFGPLGCCLIKCMGARLTCMFGMFLFFLGLFLDTFYIHRAVFYVDHLILMGIGGALAYTAAMSSAVDRFRSHLPSALLIMSISSPVGTALFYPLSAFILSLFQGKISLRWHSLSMAIIVLVLISSTHVFPSRMPRHLNPFFQRNKSRKERVKDCVDQSKLPQLDECGIPIPGTGEDGTTKKSCLCVCVCDISVMTDVTFLLWALLCLCAMLSFYIPYLFLAKYANDVITPPRARGNPITLILLFCISSLVGRVATMFNVDWTFGYNRFMFIGIMIGSGILYLFAVKADTFGWIIVLALALGCLEGLMSTTIPRLTLQTVPRKWMSSSWPYIVICLALGLMIGPIILVSAWYGTGGFYGIGFVVIGISQIIAGILAFILPNEEESDAIQRPTPAGPPPPRPESYYFGPNPYSKRLAELSSSGGGMSFGSYSSFSSSFGMGMGGFGMSPFGMGAAPGTPGFAAAASMEAKAYLARCGGCANIGQGCVSSNPGACEYGSNCPICSKIGAIPGCCDCLPGLAAKGAMNPCSSSGPSSYSTDLNMDNGRGAGGPSGGSGTGGFNGGGSNGPGNSDGGANASNNSGQGADGMNSSSGSSGKPIGFVSGVPRNDPQQGQDETADGTVRRTNYEVRHKTTTSSPKK